MFGRDGKRRVKVWLDLPPGLADFVDELRQRYGYRTRSETIRHMLADYKAWIELQRWPPFWITDLFRRVMELDPNLAMVVMERLPDIIEEAIKELVEGVKKNAEVAKAP